MMRLIGCVLGLVFILISNTAQSTTVEGKADEVKVLVRQNFGISVFALARLISVHEGGYMPKRMLAADSGMERISELQDAGLLVIEERTGLPDGSMREEAFVSVKLTDAGRAVVDAFQE